MVENSSTEPTELDLDATDRTLLDALQQDGRLGYAELGNLVGLTGGGARKRVMRLEEHGIVQIVGVTDPLRLGYRSMAMVGIVADGDVEEIARKLNEIENVVYVVISAGSFDLLVEVIAKDQDAIFQVINGRVRRVPGVSRMETFPYYSIQTHRFGWGTP
ncbi:Lrp/AsnC family transcriptional regulator for asnA, asnC and gidA [Leucobacter exalbidus]|uniref:Lrp/AsnC family transcriptional regulator for asnA, asnC and gidA n=1 Tax=Leucobacter exalbidus TaxID=662960 RepID=A0A940PVG2_9MICO|nr:Lrp/AsnC family transcriptional regulator [Leucobacter exalbidus]MBP1326034.1 Lrp/AsnC family transcriptional regulator for asnA, asnC and gidA [Leucobacter exalbidus]